MSLSKAAELLHTSSLAVVEGARQGGVTLGAGAEHYGRGKARVRRAPPLKVDQRIKP